MEKYPETGRCPIRVRKDKYVSVPTDTQPVMYQGQQVGTVKEYSDRLLIQLLKARRPENSTRGYR